MSEASMAWRENDTPDEAARLEELARALAAMQRRSTATQGILAARLDVSGTGAGPTPR